MTTDQLDPDLQRLRRPARLRSVQVGNLKISYVPDGASKIVPRALLPETTEQDWAANADYLDESGWLTVSAGGLLVESGERALLVDAGFGPFASAPADLQHPSLARMYGGAFLDNLRRLGRRPEDVEAIAFTHLHVEHVGWACHPEPDDDRPAFPHAEYLLSPQEWDGRRAGYGVSQVMLDTMAPRVRTISDGEEIFPGVQAVALPGHTPGQLGYAITSAGAQLLAFADVMHSPVQVAHPDWAVVADDPHAAPWSRQRILDALADQETIGYGAHFADVVFGQVRRTGGGLDWVPLS